MKRKLKAFKRVDDHEWIGGVCGGFAYWLGVPTWMVRLALIVLLLYCGVGLILYILIWIFAPKWDEDPKDYEKRTSS